MNTEQMSQVLIRKALGESNTPETSQNTMVLSCGGVYIPHSNYKKQAIHQMLHMHDKEEPVKFYASNRPNNVLHALLIKESLN